MAPTPGKHPISSPHWLFTLSPYCCPGNTLKNQQHKCQKALLPVAWPLLPMCWSPKSVGTVEDGVDPPWLLTEIPSAQPPPAFTASTPSIPPVANQPCRSDCETISAMGHGDISRRKKAPINPFLLWKLTGFLLLEVLTQQIASRSQSSTPSAPLNFPQISPTWINLKAKLAKPSSPHQPIPPLCHQVPLPCWSPGAPGKQLPVYSLGEGLFKWSPMLTWGEDITCKAAQLFVEQHWRDPA